MMFQRFPKMKKKLWIPVSVALIAYASICLLAIEGCCPSCPAAEVNGVLVNERVVILPQDQSKWYISVVGTNEAEHYERILQWFDTDKQLKKLKSQVHFRSVMSDTPIFNERYKPNISGLPTVRVQKADGTVVYEASGKNLPLTAGGLYGAIANSTFMSQGIRPILPWRDKMEDRCPGPCPQPAPDPDPEPPPLDDGGPPEVVKTGVSGIVVVLLMFVSFIAGGAWGCLVQWKKTYSQK